MPVSIAAPALWNALLAVWQASALLAFQKALKTMLPPPPSTGIG